MGTVLNLFVIMAVGVIVADLVSKPSGTNTLFCGVSSLWSTGVSGMMGNQVPSYNCGTPPATAQAI